MKIVTTVLFLISILACTTKKFLSEDRDEVCYAIERNETYLKGFIYLNPENEILLEFKYGVDSIVTTANLIGCSDNITKSITGLKLAYGVLF